MLVPNTNTRARCTGDDESAPIKKRPGTRPVGAAQLAVKDTSTNGPVFAATPDYSSTGCSRSVPCVSPPTHNREPYDTRIVLSNIIFSPAAPSAPTWWRGTVPPRSCSSRVRPAARRCAGWYPRMRPCQPRCITNRRQRGWQRCEPSSAATLALLVHPLPRLPQLARPRPLLPPPPARLHLPRGHRNGPFTEGS